MNLRSIVAILASVLILVGGCTGGEVASDPPQGSNASTEDVPAEEEPVEDPKFGNAFTYDDDLSVQISEPETFKPSQFAALVEKWPDYVKFDVTIVNGTKKKFDTSMIYFTVQSKDKEAEEVFDADKGFNGAPTTTLLPGRQAKYKVGFGVLDANDLVMDFTTGDFEHEDLTFTR